MLAKVEDLEHRTDELIGPYESHRAPRGGGGSDDAGEFVGGGQGQAFQPGQLDVHVFIVGREGCEFRQSDIVGAFDGAAQVQAISHNVSGLRAPLRLATRLETRHQQWLPLGNSRAHRKRAGRRLMIERRPVA